MIFEFMDGGFSYDEGLVMANIVRHPYILILAAGAAIGGLMQQVGSVMAGFKEKSYGGIPMFCTAIFFAHDTTFFLNYNHWFHETDNFLLQGLWFVFLPYIVCEILGMYLILKYGRKELFPAMTFNQALLSYLGLQVFAFAGFWWFMSFLDDPMFLIKFAITIIVSPMFCIPMLYARGSRRGFSATCVYGTLLMTVSFWLWLLLSELYFQQPMIIIVGLGNIAMAFATLRYWKKLPCYQPQPQPQPVIL